MLHDTVFVGKLVKTYRILTLMGCIVELLFYFCIWYFIFLLFGIFQVLEHGSTGMFVVVVVKVVTVLVIVVVEEFVILLVCYLVICLVKVDGMLVIT